MRKFNLFAATALTVTLAISMTGGAFAQATPPAGVRATQGDAQGAVRSTTGGEGGVRPAQADRQGSVRPTTGGEGGVRPAQADAQGTVRPAQADGQGTVRR